MTFLQKGLLLTGGKIKGGVGKSALAFKIGTSLSLAKPDGAILFFDALILR